MFRHGDTELHPFPVHNTNFFSIATFHWITGFVWKAYKNDSITQNDMWTVCQEESAQSNGERWNFLCCLLTFNFACFLVLFMQLIQMTRLK